MSEKHRLPGVVLLVVLLVVLYFQAFEWMVGSWLTNPFYAHGFLVLPVAIVLGWLATRKLGPLPGQDSGGLQGLVVLVPGLLVYLGGILAQATFVTALTLPVVALGIVYFLYGRAVARALLFPGLLLFLMVPLPFVDPLATGLASISASLATAAVNVIGVPAVNAGAEVLLSGSTLVVGVPCSGMSSLISLLLPALVLLYLVEGARWRKAVVLALFVPVALAANVLRIAALLAIAAWFGEPLALGFFHTFYGLAMPVVAFVAIIVISRCLGCVKLRNI